VGAMVSAEHDLPEFEGSRRVEFESDARYQISRRRLKRRMMGVMIGIVISGRRRIPDHPTAVESQLFKL
jgi:hypothetical protein